MIDFIVLVDRQELNQLKTFDLGQSCFLHGSINSKPFDLIMGLLA